MIFGHGVAVSRDQYNVFVMELSNGTDIRPQEPSGEPVLVPFDVLEKTDRNGLTLR